MKPYRAHFQTYKRADRPPRLKHLRLRGIQFEFDDLSKLLQNHKGQLHWLALERCNLLSGTWKAILALLFQIQILNILRLDELTERYFRIAFPRTGHIESFEAYEPEAFDSVADIVDLSGPLEYQVVVDELDDLQKRITEVQEDCILTEETYHNDDFLSLFD